MYEYIIKEYINKLTLNDIKNIALNEEIILSDNDSKVIFTFIKSNYKKALKNPDLIDITELKDKLDLKTYDSVCNVYYKYKEKFLK